MSKRNDELVALAQAVMTLVETAHRQISQRVDLTRLQVLGASAHGPVRPGEIAERLDLTNSAVSRHLSALHAAGQIRIREDPLDARTYLAEISDAGAAAADAAVAAGARRFAHVVADWSDKEVETARRSVERLLDAWGKPAATEPLPGQPSTSPGRPGWRQRIDEGETS